MTDIIQSDKESKKRSREEDTSIQENKMEIDELLNLPEELNLIENDVLKIVEIINILYNDNKESSSTNYNNKNTINFIIKKIFEDNKIVTKYIDVILKSFNINRDINNINKQDLNFIYNKDKQNDEIINTIKYIYTVNKIYINFDTISDSIKNKYRYKDLDFELEIDNSKRIKDDNIINKELFTLSINESQNIVGDITINNIKIENIDIKNEIINKISLIDIISESDIKTHYEILFLINNKETYKSILEIKNSEIIISIIKKLLFNENFNKKIKDKTNKIELIKKLYDECLIEYKNNIIIYYFQYVEEIIRTYIIENIIIELNNDINKLDIFRIEQINNFIKTETFKILINNIITYYTYEFYKLQDIYVYIYNYLIMIYIYYIYENICESNSEYDKDSKFFLYLITNTNNEDILINPNIYKFKKIYRNFMYKYLLKNNYNENINYLDLILDIKNSYSSYENYSYLVIFLFNTFSTTIKLFETLDKLSKVDNNNPDTILSAIKGNTNLTLSYRNFNTILNNIIGNNAKKDINICFKLLKEANIYNKIELIKSLLEKKNTTMDVSKKEYIELIITKDELIDKYIDKINNTTIDCKLYNHIDGYPLIVFKSKKILELDNINDYFNKEIKYKLVEIPTRYNLDNENFITTIINCNYEDGIKYRLFQDEFKKDLSPNEYSNDLLNVIYNDNFKDNITKYCFTIFIFFNKIIIPSNEITKWYNVPKNIKIPILTSYMRNELNIPLTQSNIYEKISHNNIRYSSEFIIRNNILNNYLNKIADILKKIYNNQNIFVKPSHTSKDSGYYISFTTYNYTNKESTDIAHLSLHPNNFDHKHKENKFHFQTNDKMIYLKPEFIINKDTNIINKINVINTSNQPINDKNMKKNIDELNEIFDSFMQTLMYTNAIIYQNFTPQELINREIFEKHVSKNDTTYKNKYMKYKQKYLELSKEMKKLNLI